jgi:Protein of unknown function (DUF3489)
MKGITMGRIKTAMTAEPVGLVPVSDTISNRKRGRSGASTSEGKVTPLAGARDRPGVTRGDKQRCVDAAGRGTINTEVIQAKPDPAHVPILKRDQLIAMLARDNGASIAEIAAALSWLPHTSRAALTGLRRKGYTIERIVGPDGGTSRHRINQSVIAGIASDRIKTPRVLSPGSVKPKRGR